MSSRPNWVGWKKQLLSGPKHFFLGDHEQMYLDVIEISGDSIDRGEAGKVVHNPLVDCVPEHCLDNLPEHDDHLAPQPNVPVSQVKHLYNDKNNNKTKYFWL